VVLTSLVKTSEQRNHLSGERVFLGETGKPQHFSLFNRRDAPIEQMLHKKIASSVSGEISE
jgi:hypothetical protein